MAHVNLQAAQSSDITRLLKRDFPRQFRRANRFGNVYGALGSGIHGGLPFILAIVLAALFFIVHTGSILAPLLLLGVPVLWFGMTCLLYFPYDRALRSLSALAEEQYRVRLCLVGDGEAVVEGDSQDLSDISTDMFETRRFLSEQQVQ